MNTDHDPVRLLLGAYVLGGLDDSDRRAVESHLPSCSECREELARSAPLPGLLRRLPAASALPPPVDELPAPTTDTLDRLLHQVRATRTTQRRRAKWQWLSLAASIVFVVALSVGMLLPGRQAEAPSAATLALSSVSGSTTAGRATMTAKPWGTSVTVTIAGLPGHGPFVLQVRGAGGRVEQAATWATTPTRTANVTGASSMSPSDVRSIAVLDADGHTLATTDSL